MRLIATDFYTLHRPSECDLRVYLKHQGVQGDPPSAFEEVIIGLGNRHERAHLKGFPEAVDLSGGTFEDREQRTREEVSRGAPVIYQPVLRSEVELSGILCEVVGEPDFLVQQSGGYAIRDSKLARRINERDHPEIIAQVGLYGWLFEACFGTPPQGLEVHAGSGEIVPIPYDGGAAALDALQHIVAIKRKTEEPYSPVGWTKCGGCPYNARCWRLAEQTNDLARIAGVDQGLSIALREAGVTTPEELVDQFDEAQLAGFQRPWGQRRQPVGARAGQILTMARALASGEIEILQAPQIPDSSNYVMFDLEGLPPFHDDLDRVYLWGMKVCGDNPSDFLPAVAGFGPNGDREGWLTFLDQAQRIFDQYGDIPFVHWASYERTKLSGYIERYDDKNGVGERVMSSLVDLLPITQSSVALPLPSYSLKVVEQHIGFERTSDDARGDWAMATFIEATETEDEARRSALMDQILHYNEEDLDATWAVLQWLQSV